MYLTEMKSFIPSELFRCIKSFIDLPKLGVVPPSRRLAQSSSRVAPTEEYHLVM